MIGQQHNDGVAGEAGILERGEHHAYLIVDVGYGPVIGAARGARLRFGHRLQVQSDDVAQPRACGSVCAAAAGTRGMSMATPS